MTKPTDLDEMVKRLSPLQGKLSVGSFSIFGMMPVRPGDVTHQLSKVSAQGDRLDLVFEVQSAGAPDLTLSIWKPAGLTSSKDAVTVKKAARISFAQTLDVRHEGNGLEVTADGEKSRRPEPSGPALEIR